MGLTAKKALGAARKYTDEKIDEALTSMYTPGGSKAVAELTAALLTEGNEGKVFNISDSGETTDLFVEGAGKPIHPGDNVDVVNVGTSGTPVYKFDMFYGADLSGYIEKSQTPGLMKNDGTVDQTQYVSDVSGKADLTLVAPVEANAAASQAYAQGSFFVHDGKFYEATAAIAQGDPIVVSGAGQNATERTLAYVLEHGGGGDISGKADKVISATNGNFAGLDVNGNLTDSGKKPGDFLTQHQDISGKANIEELAPAFSTSAGYKVGDYVTYDGGLYRFTSAHSAGAWNSSHVAKVSATGQYVTAGKASGTSLGIKATAEGKDTTATGNYAHAEGNATSASGVSSHAEGDGTNASGDASHAEGWAMSASGDASHAEGDVTNAHGIAAHAEGSNTSAYGDYSHSEGEATEAIGEASHAQNYGTIANRKSQTALGEFNTVDTAGQDGTVRGQYAVIVGNGSDDDNRSNAHTLDWSGNAWFAGGLIVSGDIEGHETFVGTSAEWTALSSAQKARYTFVCLTDDAGVYTNAPLPVLVSALTGTGSTVTRTVNNVSISSDMRVIQSEVSNPSALLSDLTVTTTNGTVTISGTVNGTMDVMLLLQTCRPQITG